VFLAHDEELDREVALKEIQAPFADDPDSRTRFVREGKVTGGLEHPGIVPVYGLGVRADGRPYYAMRFIKGETFQDAITAFHKADVPGRDPGERSLALHQLLRRFIDVCNAIAYAHNRGVVHRDLKPDNVMLGSYGETLVVDWGLARAFGQADDEAGAAEVRPERPAGSNQAVTQAGAVIGTPAYMSPEQAAGMFAELGPAADVYSLGATLYCLLTGKTPFHEPDVLVKLVRVQFGEFPPPRQVKRQESRLGGEDVGVVTSGRRVPLLGHDDHPDVVQDAPAEEPIVPGRGEDVRDEAPVGLVQAAEVAGRLAQAHPPVHDLGRQRPLGLVAAPARLDVRRQFLAALDLPGDGRQVVVPPGAPAGKDQEGPEGSGEGGPGEQGGAKVHDRSPSSTRTRVRERSGRGRFARRRPRGNSAEVTRSSSESFRRANGLDRLRRWVRFSI
jgi:serine/threonine protein kinase